MEIKAALAFLILGLIGCSTVQKTNFKTSTLRGPSSTSTDLFYYKFEFQNVMMKTNEITSELAKSVSWSEPFEACIDLRSGSSSSTGSFENRDFTTRLTVEVLMNEPFANEFTKSVQDKVCRFSGKDCSVTSSFVSEAISALSINLWFQEKGSRKITLSNQDLSNLPMFSNACVSGHHEQSWNDAAGTKNARAMLKQLGVNAEEFKKVRTLGIEGSEIKHTFGFPYHKRPY